MTFLAYPLRMGRAPHDAPVFRAYRQRRHPRIAASPSGSVDLKPLFPPIPRERHDIPCDTAAAIVAILQYEDPQWTGSKLFLYYNERVVEGCERSDLGRLLGDGVRALARQGVCSESAWPFRTDQVDVQPSNACYQEAEASRAWAIYSLPNDMESMKHCLAAGWPFLVGVAVYPSWDAPRASREVIPWPAAGEVSLGGTAAVCVGYDDRLGVWRMRGRRGYFTLPYRYLLDSSMSTELWVVSAR